MQKSTVYDLIVVGGGAAGYMTAIQAAAHLPSLKIAICEKSQKTLSKVRISGGGRCNVTHAVWTPRELTKFYPRGEKELLGPFSKFMTGDTVEFFENNGVPLKIESDNRMFPKSDTSEDIAKTLESLVASHNIPVFHSFGLIDFRKTDDDFWKLEFAHKKMMLTRKIMLACGSSKPIWRLLEGKDITIIPPVPSLFTFKTNDSRIKDLPGVSVLDASTSIPELDLYERGPVLITHWGLSGPGILKLSALGARELHERKYKFTCQINYLPDYYQDWGEFAEEWKHKYGHLSIRNVRLDNIPKRLFHNLIRSIPHHKNIANFTKEELIKLYNALCKVEFKVDGKTTFKEEFVTAGGVDLKEMDLRYFYLKKYPDFYIAGELLNIDALTGGFNFQAAWTGGYIAGKHIAESLA